MEATSRKRSCRAHGTRDIRLGRSSENLIETTEESGDMLRDSVATIFRPLEQKKKRQIYGINRTKNDREDDPRPKPG